MTGASMLDFFAVINTPDNNLMGGFTPKMVDFVSGSLVIGKVMAKGYCEDNSQDTDRKESGTNVFFQKSSAIYLLQTGLSLTTSHLCLITPIKVWVYQWINHWPGQNPRAQLLTQGPSADKQALTHELLLAIVSNWQCSKAITTLWHRESDSMERGWPDAPLSLLDSSQFMSSFSFVPLSKVKVTVGITIFRELF